MLTEELRAALLGVVARAAELGDTFADEVEARRAAAVGERLVSGDAEGLLSALPLAARQIPTRVGRWLREGEDAPGAGRVLLDATGRPLLHQRVRDGYAYTIWRYEADRTEQADHRGSVIWVLAPHGAVGAGPAERWAERWTWRGDELVRVDRGSAEPRSWPVATATRAELDDAGALRALWSGWESDELREDNRLGEDEWLPALEAALARAAGIACDRRSWFTPRDAPAPLRPDTAGLAGELADALADAIAAAAAEAALPAPFCVRVAAGSDPHPLLPPRVLLGDERWSRGIGGLSAVSDLWKGVEAGDVVELELTDRLSDSALRGCAELAQALDIYADPADTARAEPVYAELADRLTARLAEPGRIAGATPELLGLVHLGERYPQPGEEPALQRARRVLGPAPVQRFLGALRSGAPRREPLPRKLAAQALRDRDALQRLLAGFGLEAHAERLAHEVAAVGLLLRVTGDGRVGSRLGGPPLLPPGGEWPVTAGGRPLSFLAGIDLAELPPADDRPRSGWWLFFADLGYDDNGDAFSEPAANRPGERARLLVVAAGETPEPATPRGDELNHLSVVFEPLLTLPDPASAGLDVYERRAYEAATDALWEAGGEPEWLGAQHWVGGHVPDAQGATPEPGTVLLLHLADEATLGFGFLDAGTLQFVIPADALARGDYGAVRAEPSSG